jgi:serine/threonine-protein kinase
VLEPPIPEDEEKRLALLRACNIIYTPAEAAFDEVAHLAADLCGTEIALITLVDADYQWFKARVGVEQEGTPRDLSFCGHCINHTVPLVVEDTLKDARFADNPLVTGPPHLRFYAGVPLLVEEGSSIGALSVASCAPRSLTPKQLASLERLARQISRELRLRRDAARAGEGRPSAVALGFAPGTLLGGRWTVIRELGRGAAGYVLEARGPGDERAAVKVLRPEWRSREGAVDRFVREARVLMRIRSPHVGKLLDVGNLDAEDGALPYLALEYLEGRDLERFIETNGSARARDAFAWCADACDGLAEAHELGVVHRDLKPSNVFLAETAGVATPTVKVLDFGIAAGDPAALGPSPLTKTDMIIGTPAYMAPEQMMSPADVDPRSDVWSMGALLYQLVTGELPFRGDSQLELFANVLTKPPLPVRGRLKENVGEVEAVLLRCLRRERGDRFGSMNELATALRDAIPRLA